MLTKTRMFLTGSTRWRPDQNRTKIVWLDGSEEQLNELRDQAIATGEMERLNEEKLPGCLLHRTAINDVARVEGRTFICSREKEKCRSTNNWEDPRSCIPN